MAGEKHLYLVAKGTYNDVALEAETWQYGIRIWADVSVPEDVGTLPTTGDYAADSVSDTRDGNLITSEWKWTVGLGTVIDPLDYLEQCAPLFSDFQESAWFSTKSILTGLALYPIVDGTGRAFEGRSAQLTYGTPVAGGSSSSMMPTECAVCLSWTTGLLGRHGRGRIYMPALTTFVNTSLGFVNTSVTTDMAAAGVTLLEGIAVESVSPTATHARPIVTGKPWRSYGVITGVNVGNVWDAQRRRRRQLVETRAEDTPSYG